WSSGHLAWNNGHHDQWVNQKQDVMTMGYLKREDVSFHYALADAFTICDSYFCSVHANTCMNRIYMWSGTMDAQNVYGTRPNGPGFDERHHTNGYTWTTYPERLEKAGVSWKVYQGGSGVPGEPTDNYTDNSLEFFAQYHVQEGASPESPLVKKGVTDRSLKGFKEDVQSGELAQVSWVVAPYKYSEHPEASPTDGAYYVSLVLDALTSNPDVWNKTVMLINYDENDGLFDHIVPPMPPKSQQPGQHGMVSADLYASLKDEFIDMDKYPEQRHPKVEGADRGGVQPIGLGPRVPMLVISPWSTGGWVCSQTFDHTSVIQFLEARFGVKEPNISAWRRSVCGDLTSAFDFSQTSGHQSKSFPPPAPIKSLHQPYSVPKVQKMPVQEKGTRPARPLPYWVETACKVDSDRVTMSLTNKGKAGAAFYIYNRTEAKQEPRRYTVSAGDTLADFWMPGPGGRFDLAVYGPNGSMAHHKGTVSAEEPVIELQQDPTKNVIRVALKNRSHDSQNFNIGECYTKLRVQKSVPAGEEISVEIPVSSSSGWFDVSVEAAKADSFLRRFAGHIEDGKPSMSDPALSS
ncbi:MAG TPA: phospholipase C, phosphocholine-specific, partial [Edaphobacter sp.]|nr:phospholipase C, phosphocholine-specific [Edaphobacter sp.]